MGRRGSFFREGMAVWSGRCKMAWYCWLKVLECVGWCGVEAEVEDEVLVLFGVILECRCKVGMGIFNQFELGKQRRR